MVVLCQERHPGRYDLGGATVVRPQIDSPSPVFVLDRHSDAQAQLLVEMGWAERNRFVEQNAAAVRQQGPADLLLANHVLLGGPVAAASGLPHVVKAHGSELEFALRRDAGLRAWARESLTQATAVLAGSQHVVRVLDELVGPDPATVQVVPPGVDVEQLRPEDRTGALAALLAECSQDELGERLRAFFDGDRTTVLYVGRLSAEKGVGILVEALKRVDARALVVGTGPARAELEAAAGPDVVFTGPLEHQHLAHLWPLADVSVAPSAFPEAFGMVAAEAASCGCPPLVARHSGLAEVAAVLEAEYPKPLRHLASFRSGDVEDLADRLAAFLALPAQDWQALSAGARRAAERRWSWTNVARQILAVGVDGSGGDAAPGRDGGSTESEGRRADRPS